MTAKLCVLAVAAVVIARARVTILPGWQVPLTAVLIAVTLTAGAALVGWLAWQEHRPCRAPRHARTRRACRREPQHPVHQVTTCRARPTARRTP